MGRNLPQRPASPHRRIPLALREPILFEQAPRVARGLGRHHPLSAQLPHHRPCLHPFATAPVLLLLHPPRTPARRRCHSPAARYGGFEPHGKTAAHEDIPPCILLHLVCRYAFMFCDRREMGFVVCGWFCINIGGRKSEHENLGRRLGSPAAGHPARMECGLYPRFRLSPLRVGDGRPLHHRHGLRHFWPPRSPSFPALPRPRAGHELPLPANTPRAHPAQSAERHCTRQLHPQPATLRPLLREISPHPRRNERRKEHGRPLPFGRLSQTFAFTAR